MFIHHSLIQEFRIGVSVEQTIPEALQHRHTTEQLQEQFKVKRFLIAGTLQLI